MSKLGEQLRLYCKVYNVHNMLTQFGYKGKDIAINYRNGESRGCMSNNTKVFSPSFKTDPDAAWFYYGCKAFIGKRSVSMPKAIAWATEKYGVTDWVTSPTSRNTKIPKYVLDRAKTAIKEIVKATSSTNLLAPAQES